MRQSLFLLVTIGIAVVSLPAGGQVATATLPTQVFPASIAANAATNQIYVANNCGSDESCQSPGTVTVINGLTQGSQTVNVGYYPYGLAVNSVTNKIYVASCGTDPSCSSNGAVAVIDGTTLHVQNVTVGVNPNWVAVDSTRNKIYVSDQGCNSLPCSVPGSVTVIDGSSLATTTVPAGYTPWSLAVDSTHDKIYVANVCISGSNCGQGGVTVIDGQTLGTQFVNAQITPLRVAVNPTTNKIYVANNCGNDPNCRSNGSVTVIDGATLNTRNVQVGYYPGPISVNPVTNKIYVADQCSAPIPQCYQSLPDVGIIDGNTLSTSFVTICGTDVYPSDVQVNTSTNQIYLPCAGRNDGLGYSTGLSVAVLNGATNVVTPVAVGDYPFAAAINATTNTIYVPNVGDNTVSVIGGATTLEFVNVTPCRLVDTRGAGGPIQGNTSRNFPIPQLGGCNIPPNAVSYSLNVTVVPEGPLGYLTIWPTSQMQPVVSTMNSPDGRTKANAAIVQGGLGSSVSVYVRNTTNLILDIDGYFAPSTGSTLQFFSLPPCRVLDTRGANGPLGGPHLNGEQPREFPVLSSDCNIPSNAAAYSLNFTVVPVGGPLGYLTVWPTGQAQPQVSTLNNPTATIVANAAIVPAGSDGQISVYANQNTQLIADIDGYFAPAGQGGMSLHPTAPCRVLDTRSAGGAFSGKLPVNVAGSACSPPAAALAYVFNATVVPSGPLGYLTLWPDGQQQPLASTLNATDGLITSNMAIVPTGNGKIDAYASSMTQLIMDISSYFAP